MHFSKVHSVHFSCLFVFTFSLLLFTNAKAQTLEIEGVEQIGIVYKEIYHAGLTIHSAGWGINYRRGKNITAYSYKFLDFSITGMKHPKEVKTFNPFYQNSSGYVYGKQNSLTILRAGVGKLKEINSKGDIGGFAVSYSYFFGPTIGFQKPVYLEVYYPDAGILDPNLRIERYDETKHFTDNIYGRAPFSNGLSEMRFVPGLYAAFNFNFEFGKSQQTIRMIETGAGIDLFSRKIPMMAFEENTPLFLSFHIRLLYGKRWNK
jgi:hypothetical protein